MTRLPVAFAAALLAALTLARPSPALDADETITWEKDASVALKRAEKEKKLLLTFVVVGELGKGC